MFWDLNPKLNLVTVGWNWHWDGYLIYLICALDHNVIELIFRRIVMENLEVGKDVIIELTGGNTYRGQIKEIKNGKITVDVELEINDRDWMDDNTLLSRICNHLIAIGDKVKNYK